MRWLIFFSFLWAGGAMADAVADRNWTYVSDRVMGGVSEGSARLQDGALVLQGRVSTANNGGFIQVRTDVGRGGLTGDGISLRAKGNGEVYYIHIRTPQTRRPWHYFRATFTADADWTGIRLPWSAFKAANSQMPSTFDPADVTSVGLVAYGRDYDADLQVSDFGTFTTGN